MARSLRKTAPSSSVAASKNTATKPIQTQKCSQLKAQLHSRLKTPVNNTSFGRVTKSRFSHPGLHDKFSNVEKEAFERWDEGQKREEATVKRITVGVPKTPDSEVSTVTLKRKRGDLTNESEIETDTETETETGNQTRRYSRLRESCKKPRPFAQDQLLSPPVSRDGTDRDDEDIGYQTPRKQHSASPRNRRVNAAVPSSVELPRFLLDMISMHAAFLKALSLHFAHNGAGSPVEMSALMDSVTRLWKKQTVREDAVQRMLGLYEYCACLTSPYAIEIEQRQCPFKIVKSGLGSSVRTNLEFIGSKPYNENNLQATYSDIAHRCLRGSSAMIDNTKIPLLTIEIGTQTSLHRAKAASTRAEILGLSASTSSRSTPDFSKLSITDLADHTPMAVKSRTLSLFDRVRAKGLAAANNVAPTSEQIARRHAMGRISEVVEFLRMKQQQKLCNQFHDSVHDSPGKLRGTGKISFSLSAIVNDIRQSVAVPIGEEEIRVCLRMLSREVPGDWCRVLEVGAVSSITLRGSGMSGVEVKKMLEAKELKI